MASSKTPPDDVAPWRKGTDVKGVTPPGRMLDSSRPRKEKWGASGVSGVTPPGSSSGRAASKGQQQKKQQAAYKKALASAEQGGSAEVPAAIVPSAGFQPKPFQDRGDPHDLLGLFQVFVKAVEELCLPSSVSLDVQSLIRQSRSPAELVVGYAMLKALVGDDADLKKRRGPALHRGQAALYAYLHRVNPDFEIPVAADISRVESLFYGLSDLALAQPVPVLVEAFCRASELLNGPDVAFEEVCKSAVALYQKYVVGRSFGDHSLEALFPLPSYLQSTREELEDED